MDQRLLKILESLLLNIQTLNDEVLRMAMNEQFLPESENFRLLEKIRCSHVYGLKNIQTIEKSLFDSQQDGSVIPPDMPTH
jgi:hypothetical protein